MPLDRCLRRVPRKGALFVLGGTRRPPDGRHCHLHGVLRAVLQGTCALQGTRALQGISRVFARTFIACYVTVLAASCSANDAANAPTTVAGCASDRIDEHVTVDHVYDGDTVRLSDGRKVRFIGIDTPEVGRNGAPSQPLASEARNALETLLGSGKAISLRYDEERQDRYGRDLAHIFLENGMSIEARLLEQGLATVLTYPPNTWNLACYQAAEQRARKAQRGIWSLPQYQPVDAASVTGDERGFRLIKGKVTRVSEDRGGLSLELSGGIRLYISRKNRHYFASSPPEGWRGRTVLVRGKLSSEGEGSSRIHIRHPAALQVIE